ncbi:hypothetical protein DNTS_028283 [Danionella cerebrum]|uniref:CRIB domain-containing protein n=1 Tax=Danionella cerebrum TaxID=2873325 RepID=A0A553N5Z8_9TELE|nr:hypothetical protein DNTS_028283 [Danionella translucida]
MPILKQLVSSSSQSKRRSRADLTAEMISAPLGDFRHTMHVGRGGDAFGDTSFLSTRSGEPPKEPEVQQSSPKQSVLSRAFRSSKRSQSVNRDKPDKSKLAPSGDSPGYITSAISLPYLNEDDSGRGSGVYFTKSVSSSPLKNLAEKDGKLHEGKPLNGATASSMSDLELDERSFGELTDLRPSVPYTGGMKHAESIMSFHIDLGPSMLGDILSVMEKKGLDDDDLGFEEGKSCSSPFRSPLNEVEDLVPLNRPLHERPSTNPYTPELQTRSQHLDSCSVSSSGSTVLDEKPQVYDGNMVNVKYSLPLVQDDRDFSYMDDDEDDDEIRV